MVPPRSSSKRVFFFPPESRRLAFAFGAVSSLLLAPLVSGGLQIVGLVLVGATLGGLLAPRRVYLVRGSRKALTGWWEVLRIPLSHRQVLALLDGEGSVRWEESKDQSRLWLEAPGTAPILLEEARGSTPDLEQRRAWLEAILAKAVS